MRLSVASTGGGAGSLSSGNAARRSARYSSTGNTTQPSVATAVVCARLVGVCDGQEDQDERGDGNPKIRGAHSISVVVGFHWFLLLEKLNAASAKDLHTWSAVAGTALLPGTFSQQVGVNKAVPGHRTPKRPPDTRLQRRVANDSMTYFGSDRD
jgi:hypothetical protein